MHRHLRRVLVIVSVCWIVPVSASAKDKAKTPVKKDTPKTTSCQNQPSGGKMKTADKAFNAVDCYIRG